jgi:two-component system chemotaxis response regulator CheB
MKMTGPTTLHAATSSGHPDIIVVGGSSGSLEPLTTILSSLPEDLAAAVFVVQHRGAGSRPPLLSLGNICKLPVMLAEDNAPLRAGTVCFAPANLHLLLEGEKMRVMHGPRENLARPSIDVLFRSAAVAFGPRVIGVILSGDLDDGELGLAAVRRCGGYTIVQAPEDSASPSMPAAALRTEPDATLTAEEIGASLVRLVTGPARPARTVPSDLALEARAAAVAMTDPDDLSRVGSASHFTCPECQGPLWLMPSQPEQYRCDVGHAFTLSSLAHGQALELERALWVAYRVVNERSRLLEHMAKSSTERGMTGAAAGYVERRKELRAHARSILDALSSLETPRDAEARPLQ